MSLKGLRQYWKKQDDRFRVRFSIALIVLSTLALYDPSRLENTSGDNLSSRYWPVALIEHHSINLDPLKEMLRGVDYAAMYGVDGHWMPRHGLGMGGVTVPFYALVRLVGGEDFKWNHETINRVSRMNGILISILSVLLMFWLLRRWLSVEMALTWSLLFAFGTWQWSIGAQGITFQTVSTFYILMSLVAFYHCCHEKKSARLNYWVMILAFTHVLVWATRLSDLFLIAPMGLVIIGRRKLVLYFMVFLPLILGLSYFYYRGYGHPLGWYSQLFGASNIQVYRGDFLTGLFGFVFSPNRGLWVFLPIVFPMFFLLRRRWVGMSLKVFFRDAFYGKVKLGDSLFFTVILISSIAYFYSTCSVTFWHSTWSYGPRYLYDLIPFLWILFVPVLMKWKTLSVSVRTLIAILAVQGVLIHGLAHFNFDIYVWHAQNTPLTEKKFWHADGWIISDTFKAGSNRNRWKSAAWRLKFFGF